MSVFKEIRKELNNGFPEREALVDGLLSALLAKSTLFILGPPGTAKSLICQTLCKAIEGKYFSWLIGKFTPPEELFGPPSFSSIKQDKYERITTGKLPEADIGFLDEIFKGSSAILNSLLTLINERVFYNGDKAIKTPLQCVIGASNELPQGEELAALYDRFVLRYEVGYLKDDKNIANVISGNASCNLPKITKADLAKEQAAAAAVKVSDEIIALILKIRAEVNSLGLSVSDRKFSQALSIIKAYAHLNGNTEVTNDDLDILENILWSTPEQRPTIRKAVNKYSNPVGAKILAITDAVAAVEADLDNVGRSGLVEVLDKVKNAANSLKKLGNKSDNPKLKKAIEYVESVQTRIVTEKLIG